MSDLSGQAERMLAVPDAFRQTALAFPEQIDAALALIEEPSAAAELLARADMLSHYARRVQVDTEIINAIQYGKLKIVAKLGELMPARPPEDRGQGRKKEGEPLPKSGSAAEPDFGKEAKAKYRKVAANQDKLDAYRDSRKPDEEMTVDGFLHFATGTAKAGLAAHVSANTGCPEWYTPAPYLDAARRVMGDIDLDPASSVVAQETVQAGRFYTVDDDGLSKSWQGRVWLNPPYTADLVGKFTAKLCEHFRAGDVPAAILLVNNATETQWFQAAARECAALCFPAGRVRFLDEEGNPGAPLQGQAVLYFGGDEKGFIHEFRGFGFCAVSR